MCSQGNSSWKLDRTVRDGKVAKQSKMFNNSAYSRLGADLFLKFYSTPRTPEKLPKTSKTGHFGVIRSKSSDRKIFVHAGSDRPSCFGTGHVTVLSDGVLRRTPAQMFQRT